MNIQHPKWKPMTAARCAILFVFAVSFFANAQTTNDSSAATDFSSFQLIVDRNIFNPDRYGHTTEHHHEYQGLPTFSLAGTMSYRKGMFAFFNGTSDEYRKALQQGGTIAGYNVTKINFDGVQLESAGRTIDMKVGAAMRKEGSSWELSAPGAWSESPSTESDTGDSNAVESSTATLPSGGGEVSDVLKRLMQQRQQEEK
jgi:hypothetical protein